MKHRQVLSELLRELRQQAEMSQETLADKAGLHRTYISQLERGLKSPTLDVLDALARALGITLKTFLAQYSRRFGS
ncbi:MAG: helix-turn-helix transcriptional regulator [Verrucomicrobiaceae bacterium]|nr:helix-turn-helix transcriptional regulator [Verrucomicrobiaceae bacterium]